MFSYDVKVDRKNTIVVIIKKSERMAGPTILLKVIVIRIYCFTPSLHCSTLNGEEDLVEANAHTSSFAT